MCGTGRLETGLLWPRKNVKAMHPPGSPGHGAPGNAATTWLFVLPGLCARPTRREGCCRLNGVVLKRRKSKDFRRSWRLVRPPKTVTDHMFRRRRPMEAGQHDPAERDSPDRRRQLEPGIRRPSCGRHRHANPDVILQSCLVGGLDVHSYVTAFVKVLPPGPTPSRTPLGVATRHIALSQP